MTKDITNEADIHTAMKSTVTSDLKRSILMNIKEHTDAERETKRSIARISFELKYLSRWNLSTIF